MPRPGNSVRETARIRVRCAALVCLLALLPAAIHLLPLRSARAEERSKGVPADLAKLTTTMKDMEATVKITKYDSVELEKIGSDFKTTYSIRNLTFQYKQPDKIRLEGRSQTRGGAILILNGPIRYYEVPRMKIHKSENLETHPGRRQSLLEYVGLLSPGTLKFMQGKLLREETFADKDAAVYEMRYQGEEKGSYYRLWIDSRTGVTLKREWYDSADKLRATFTYSDIQEVSPGIWMPTKGEVKNADGASAAAVALSDIKINQGLSDDPFTVTP